MKHIHHIVPKHIGGTDDSSNLIELTIEEHAEAHKKLYEEHNRIEDWYAWQGLSGVLSKEEIVEGLMKESGRKTGIANRGKPAWNKGKKMSEEFRETLRNSPKVKPPSRKGAKHSEESKRKMSVSARNRVNK